MYSSFTEDARKILIGAKLEMKELKHPYVGSEHLLLSILKNDKDMKNKLKDYNLTYDRFRNEIIKIIGKGTKTSTCFLYTPLLKRVMENAMYEAKENNDGEITILHLFSSLLEEGEGVAIRILINLDVDIDELYHDFAFKNMKKLKNKKLLLDDIGIDLTKKAKELDSAIGRDEEINRIIEILCRRKKNNPILIGPAGVGKTAIVEELSKRISDGNVPNNLKDKRIISLDMSTLVSGTKYRGEFEERVNKILKEVEEDDDIILFIDEIHTLVGAGGAEGAIDASNIFKPALARNKVRCIGATTTYEYKKYIKNDKALDRRFQKVDIIEPDKLTLKNILLSIKDTYSKYHKTIIKDSIIDYIIELSSKYIKNRYEPDASIDILDEVCAYSSLKEDPREKEYNKLSNKLKKILEEKKNYLLKQDYKTASKLKRKENIITTKLNNLELDISKNLNHEVTIKDVDKIVSKMCNIPIVSSKIEEIEHKIKSKIIGQDKAIDKIIKVYKRIKLGFKEENKCYSFMFVGPSGVGKTETAKILSKYLTNNFIRLDMGEYSEAHSISKLIGSPSGYVGYDDNKNVFESIKDNPFTTILLDEIDKAHPNIINLLYQILDTGALKDAKGENIYFNNTVIIMTSNIGYINNNIGFNNKNTGNIKDYFDIAFINRIDSIINFDNISYNNIKKIIYDEIEKLDKKYKLKGINIKISKETIEEVIKLSDYEIFGARHLIKLVKNDLESLIINEILDNKKNIFINKLKKEKVIN